MRQIVQASDPQLKARLHTGAGGTYLWVVNPTRQARTATLTLEETLGPFTRARELWQQNGDAKVSGRVVQVSIEDRNVAVLRLE